MSLWDDTKRLAEDTWEKTKDIFNDLADNIDKTDDEAMGTSSGIAGGGSNASLSPDSSGSSPFGGSSSSWVKPSKPKPTIPYQPPAPIYDEDRKPNYSQPQNPFFSPPPDIPLGRLPKEADGQTNIPTAGKSISVSEALSSRKFGSLLINPFLNTDLEIEHADHSDGQFHAQIKTANATGIENVGKWLGDVGSFNVTESTPTPDVVGMTVAPLAGGGQILLHGQEALSWYLGKMESQTRNVATVSTGLWKSIKRKSLSAFRTYWENGGRWISYKSPAEGWFKNLYRKSVALDFSDGSISSATEGIEGFGETIINAIAKGGAIEGFLRLNNQSMQNIAWHRLGLEDYPIKVPKSLTYIPAKDEKPENYMIEIPHMTRFLSWQILQIDALLGHFPIKMTIEDSDLIKTGDQPISIQLPNIAETLAELVGKSLQNEANNRALLSIVLRNLIETGMTRKQGIVTDRAIQAIIDYIGFDMKHTTETIDFSFNPLAGYEDDENIALQSIEKALEPTKITVKVIEEQEKESLEQKLNIFIEASRIIKGVFYRKWDKNKFISLMKSAGEATGIVDKSPSTGDNGGAPQDDFDTFLERVERGFSDVQDYAEEGDLDPWGRPFDKRPRIKELSKQNNLEGAE